jgi:hypothetical protein
MTSRSSSSGALTLGVPARRYALSATVDSPQFVLNLDPVAGPPTEMVAAARAAETAGFDLISIKGSSVPPGLPRQLGAHQPSRRQDRTDLVHAERGQPRPAATRHAGQGCRNARPSGRWPCHSRHRRRRRRSGSASMGITGRAGRAMRQYAEESVAVLKRACAGSSFAWNPSKRRSGGTRSQPAGSRPAPSRHTTPWRCMPPARCAPVARTVDAAVGPGGAARRMGRPARGRARHRPHAVAGRRQRRPAAGGRA